MMGVHLIDESRATAREVVVAGTVCAYPKFTPVPFQEEDLWNGYPEETNAPYGLAKKDAARRRAAYREQYGLNSIFLLPANLYGPRDNFDPDELARHPRADPQVLERRARQRGRALGRRLADPRVPLRRGRAEALCAGGRAVRRRGARQHRHRRRDHDRGARQTIAEVTGFDGEIAWDTTKPNGQPRRKLDASRAEQLFGFRARTSLREGLERTVAWYRAAAPAHAAR